jgi:hypothetical protein
LNKPISKLDAGTKKTWKLHQTIDEIQTWSAYLQQSAERFAEELAGYNLRSTFVGAQELKAYQEVAAALATLKKESTLLKTKSRRLHGYRK